MRGILPLPCPDVYQGKTYGIFRGLPQLRRLQSGLPGNAVTEREKPVGRLQIGMAGDVKTVTGILNPGEASGIPVIRKRLNRQEG